jgi:lipopolysaccharide assembly protein A
MRYLAWIAKFVLFVLLLGFALKNTDAVTVRYFLAQEWRAPLSLVLFLFFGAGAALGVAAALPMLYRQRRELASLRSGRTSAPRAEVQRPQPDASLL